MEKGNVEYLFQQEDKASELYEQGKMEEALHILYDLWENGLNKPQFEKENDVESMGWAICRFISDVLQDLNRNEEALEWSLKTLKFTHRSWFSSDYIEIGNIYIKLGKEQEAFEMFDKAYKEGKYRAFQGEKAAWEFYKKYKNER